MHSSRAISIHTAFLAVRGVGSIKRLGRGGTGFQGNFWILKKLLPKKFKEPRGEGERNIFPSYHTKIARF
jgi:hypothetical protein